MFLRRAISDLVKVIRGRGDAATAVLLALTLVAGIVGPYGVCVAECASSPAREAHACCPAGPSATDMVRMQVAACCGGDHIAVPVAAIAPIQTSMAMPMTLTASESPVSKAATASLPMREEPPSAPPVSRILRI